MKIGSKICLSSKVLSIENMDYVPVTAGSSEGFTRDDSLALSATLVVSVMTDFMKRSRSIFPSTVNFLAS